MEASNTFTLCLKEEYFKPLPVINNPMTEKEFTEMVTFLERNLENSSPRNPLNDIPRTFAFEEAMKEHLKDFIIEDADPVEKAKREEERRWAAKESGQKKFRRNGNNRKKTKGRKSKSRK